MKMLRSICGALGVMALMAVCSMAPAVASTPMDPGIHSMSPDTPYHPVAVIDADHVAQTCEAPSAATQAAATSYRFGHSLLQQSRFSPREMNGASVDLSHLRRRC